MIGPKVKYAITYKTNENSFELYRARFEHDFKVPKITKENFEGGIAMDLPSVNSFIVAKLDKIRFFNNETFELRPNIKLKIDLLAGNTREPNQVISMAKCISE